MRSAPARPVARDADSVQAVGWGTETLRMDKYRNRLRDMKITDVAWVETPDDAQAAIEEIFSVLSTDAPFPKGNEIGAPPTDLKGRDSATPRAFAFAQKFRDSRAFIQTANRITARKACYNGHNYKFPAAIFEDYHLVSPIWRPHMLATSTQLLYGSQSADSPVIQQAITELNRS